jgi:hypothetical protein
MTSCLNTNLVLLSTPPSFIVMSYKKMKAYGNHFKVGDEQTCLLVTYDFGVASIFQ